MAVAGPANPSTPPSLPKGQQQQWKRRPSFEEPCEALAILSLQPSPEPPIPSTHSYCFMRQCLTDRPSARFRVSSGRWRHHFISMAVDAEPGC